VLRLTLDTNCVIHAAQAQPYGPQVDEVVDLARDSRVGLWITEAFSVDQQRAPTDKHQRNLAWLSQRPTIGRIPGPFRLGYSALGGPDVFTDEDTPAVDALLCEILLPDRLQAERLEENDAAVISKWRQKVTDVQRLTAHHMAGHDAFVTSDHPRHAAPPAGHPPPDRHRRRRPGRGRPG
jgi:hypothetical protein